jgi:predicted RND superfamily exporter protein
MARPLFHPDAVFAARAHPYSSAQNFLAQASISMNEFYKYVARFPRLTILAVLAATFLFAIPIRSLHIETDVETMMPDEHPVFIYNNKVEEIFNTKKMIIVGVVNEDPNGVFNPDTLKLVEQLSLKIEAMDGIIGEDIISFQANDNIVGTDWGLEVEPLMETAPGTAEGAEELRQAVFDNKMFINNLVSPDGTATSIFAKLEEGYDKVEMYERIRRMVAEEVDVGDNMVFIAGRPMIEGMMGKYASDDMRKTLPLVILVSLVVLFLTLRSVRGMLLPLAVVVASVIWMLGIMSLMKIPLYAVTTLVPVLLIAIGLAYGIHIINRYYEQAASSPHADQKEIVLATMNEMWAPVTMASLTTAAGFLSLASSDMMPVKYFGLFTSIGVVSALAFSLTFIPAWLMILPVKYPSESSENPGHGNPNMSFGRLGRALVGSGRIIGDNPKKVLMAAAVVIVLGILGLFRVYVDGSLLSNFEEGSEVFVADTMLTEKFGGTNTLNIVIEGESNDDIKSPAMLHAIERLQRDLGAMEEVGATFSISDYMKRMNRVMNENQMEYSRIPETREMVAQYLLLYSMSGDPDDFDDVVDYDYRQANMRIRINSDHSPVLQKVIGQVRSLASEIFAGLPARIRLAGQAMTSYTFMDLIIRGQVRSILVAVALVFLITAIMFRSPAAGLFCTIPIAIATMLNFSLMGVANIPLGVSTALLSGMGIGIGVDYAIHFVSRYKHLASTHSGSKQRIQTTLGTAGRAIFFNAVVVIAGFLVLQISNFPPSRSLGTLVSINMVSSFLGAVTVLPACLAIFKPKFADTPSRKTEKGSPT